MEENNIDTSQINLRNKGIKFTSGKIYKGCVKDAFTKLSIGSIPSNYQSIIYHHEQKKGFGTSQKRFYQNQNRSQILKSQTDSQSFGKQYQQIHKVSQSNKGYGSLIAKQKRQYLKLPYSPGPGIYFKDKFQKLKQNKQKQNRKRKCFTGQRQDLKRKQIKLKRQNLNLPGPGYYQIQQINKKQLVGCKSSFVTKQQRQAYIPKSLTPGPGCYIKQQKATVSNEVKRQEQEDQYYKKFIKQKRPISKALAQRRTTCQMPGPGAYDSDIPNFKPLYQRIKISNNFILSSKDRFNESVDKIVEQTQPPVGAYQIKSSFDKIQKRLIDMPCFMSQSRRQPFSGQGLGPNVFYQPNKPNKSNFHFNIRGKWV